MAILIFLIVSYILFSITLMPLFKKAGVNPTKALIPGVNYMEMCTLVGQKKSHAAWMLFPIVNLFIHTGLCVDLVRSFGRYKFVDSALAVVYAPIIFFMMGKNEEDKYIGPTLDAEKKYFDDLEEARAAGKTRLVKKLEKNNPYHKNQAREWVEAIVFAVFAAAFIRMFLIEAYTIPTTSMEGTLLQGDFLFVSKVHYGMRTPKTIAMIPLLHNRIPMVGGESYLESPNLPFYRFPKIQDVERYGPVVFNYPEGDSVYVFPERTYSIHDFRRMGVPLKGKKLVTRPIDKKDFYIKRCVAIPGDSLQIIDQQLYINGKPAPNPEHMQLSYYCTDPNGINVKQLYNLGINVSDCYVAQQTPNGPQPIKVLSVDMPSNPREVILNLDKYEYEQVKNFGGSFTIEVVKKRPDKTLFPHDQKNFGGWSVDNFGPIWIPQKGATVKISPNNIALYKRIIDIYENNDLEIRGGKIIINGEEATEYTFQQNYYWMIGDNRHNSEDSRVWGYVPFDHVVGKPLFVWFSTKHANFTNGINWSRLFTSTNTLMKVEE